MDLNIEQLKKLFFQEADEQIDTLEKGILILEQQGQNTEVIDEMFRMAHSLKGGSGTLGFTEMAHLTHQMETLLEGLRKGTMAMNNETVDLLFISIDLLKELRFEFENEQISPKVLSSVEDLLKRYDGAELEKTASTSKENNRQRDKLPLNSFEIKFFDDIQPPVQIYLIEFDLKSVQEMQNIIAFLIANNLNKIGQIKKSSPPNLESQISELRYFTLIFETEKEKKDIEIILEQIIENNDFQIYHWDELTDEKRNEFIVQNTGFFETRNVNQDSIRIDIGKIDQLMRLVGELVIDKEHLLELAKRMKVRYKDNWEAQTLLQTIPHIDFIATELHEAVMDIRMFPVGGIFRRFPRLARDLSKQTGKQVKLLTSGEDTELDRTILQEIFDPLVHIIRNAVDHGIELPAERIKKGKPEEGTINLNARQEENNIIIEVIDDGKGIDLNNVKEKAINLNLYTRAALEEMSEGELYDILLEPGFSTAEKVSDVSGRGVGMDVVRANIKKINGAIEIQSAHNKGTTIKITLPLTMAIIQALMVQEGNNDYAIPLSSVIETVSVSRKNSSYSLKKIQNNEVIVWREKVVPVIHLNKFFKLSSDKIAGKYAVIVGVKDKPVGIIVESLMGEQEIVIKPLNDYLGTGTICGNVPGISGATIKGDGKVALILDIPSMLKAFIVEGKKQDILAAK